MKQLSRKDEALKAHLESLYDRYHRAEFLPGDPLSVVHRYKNDDDRELVALIAAAFASGNIKSILKVLDAILAPMGPRPARWLVKQSTASLSKAHAGIYHRWVRPEDISYFLATLAVTLRTYGSFKNLFLQNRNPSAPIYESLDHFVKMIHLADVAPLVYRKREMKRAGGAPSELAPIHTILLTAPSKGSACKRMHLFLRWVVRPADGVDLGLWTDVVSPARLLMPVDTHVLRISRELGLTKRKVADAKTAEEITARLRRICPDDPCRYDFSFVRAGIDK